MTKRIVGFLWGSEQETSFSAAGQAIIHNACWEGDPRFQSHIATDTSKSPTEVFFSRSPLNQCVSCIYYPATCGSRATAVAPPQPKQRRRAFKNDHILSQTGLTGPSRAPFPPPPNSPLNQSKREFAINRRPKCGLCGADHLH